MPSEVATVDGSCRSYVTIVLPQETINWSRYQDRHEGVKVSRRSKGSSVVGVTPSQGSSKVCFSRRGEVRTVCFVL